MISYNNDPTIRFDHTPVINKVAFQVNQIGPDDPYVFPAVDYTDTDSNTIYVNSESPGDDANPGTYASPKKTLLAAINATTATKTKVVVQDSATIFNEDISGGTYTYLQGIYQETTGGTSSWIARQLGFTPSDVNAVWVSKSGSDSTGTAGTQADPWLTINAAILDCDTGRNVVVIDDSGTYEEEGFTFTGNFTGLYANIGCTPIVTLSNPGIEVDIFEKVTVDGVENYAAKTYNYGTYTEKSIVLDNGNVIIAYGAGKFKILSKTGASVLGETSNGLASTNKMALLENGNIVFATGGGGGTVQFSIYTQAGVEVKAATNMTTSSGGAGTWDMSKLYSNGFVFSYMHSAGGTSYGYFKIYSNEGALVNETNMGANTYGYKIIPLRSVGRFVLVNVGDGVSHGGSYYRSFYRIYSNLGTLIKDSTLMYGSSYYSHTIELETGVSFENGDFCMTWREGAAGNPYEDEPFYGVWDSDGTVIKSPDLVSTFTNVDHIGCFRTSNDGLIISLVQHADTDRVEFACYDNAGVHVKDETAITSFADTSAVALMAQQDNACHIYNKKSGSAICQHTFLGEILFYAMTNDVAGGIVINGVTFDEDGIGGLYCFLYSENPLELSWCEFANGTPETITASGYVVAGGEMDKMQYCICRDCNNGLDLTMNTVEITWSQFYRIADGYAVYIDGTAASAGDILVEHCDFFDNYGGCHFENNDANSTVKNCIFHDNSVYDIDAEAAMTLTYSVATSGVTTTVTMGTSTTRANPTYINEGYTNPDDTDLNLKVKVLGYPANSSAYSLADENINAGSIYVQYIGADTTYTSITVPKPNKIDITYQYAGGVTTQRRDGSYASYRDGMSEVATMTWEGITAVYMAQLLTMWKSSEHLVNIYPDPVTYATSYEQWSIVREATAGGVVSPTLSDLGAQGVVLKFAKAVS